MARRKTPEKTYYEPVRRFLKNKMGCVVQSFNKDGEKLPFKERGWGRIIIDVFGVRGTPDRGSRDVEGIAVEVKGSTRKTSLRHILQASQYGRLAHRCYLAQPRKFDPKTIGEASRLGVGLFQIGRGKVKLVSESRLFTPEPETFRAFLHRSLRLVRCSACDCYRFRYSRNGGEVAVKGHWVLDEIAPPPKRGVFNKKMYLCPKCESLIGDIAGTSHFSKSLKKLTKRIARLEAKFKKDK